MMVSMPAVQCKSEFLSEMSTTSQRNAFEIVNKCHRKIPNGTMREKKALVMLYL